MRRCAHDGLTRIVDPLDVLVDTRRLLLETSDWFKFDGRATDAWSHFTSSEDADARLHTSYLRKAFLARYGRQSMLQWDCVPLTEIQRLVEALIELMKQEGSEKRVVENT